MWDGRRERRLLVRLEAARQVYNACLGESLKRLKLMRESREYQAVRKLPKGEPKSEAWKARRANNPEAFKPNGTAKSGKRQWQVSGREKETRRKLSELHRKQAAYRKSLRGNLANHVFSLGNPVKLEK